MLIHIQMYKKSISMQLTLVDTICSVLQKVLPALLHGEAVNIDMSLMVYIAHQRGLLTVEEKARITQCMLGLELPVWHQECSLALVQRALGNRLKHSAGSLRMPLPTGLGCAGLNRNTFQWQTTDSYQTECYTCLWFAVSVDTSVFFLFSRMNRNLPRYQR